MISPCLNHILCLDPMEKPSKNDIDFLLKSRTYRCSRLHVPSFQTDTAFVVPWGALGSWLAGWKHEESGQLINHEDNGDMKNHEETMKL